MIILADVGATKTSIANTVDLVSLSRVQTIQNRNYQTFYDLLDSYIGNNNPDAIYLGIAAPVSQGKASMTNIEWVIEADVLKNRYSCEVYLLNDLEAMAYALYNVDALDLTTVCSGERAEYMGDVIVAVGSGLGAAHIFQNKVQKSQAGHISFAPLNDFQKNWYDFLFQQYGYVSYEMVCSSVGFKNLVKYWNTRQSNEFVSEFVTRLQSYPDPARVVIEKMHSDDQVGNWCKSMALQHLHILGGFLGDLALVYLPNRIFLAGGIAQALSDHIYEILPSFYNKGVMSELNKSVSIYLINDKHIGLLGVFSYAQNLAGRG